MRVLVNMISLGWHDPARYRAKTVVVGDDDQYLSNCSFQWINDLLFNIDHDGGKPAADTAMMVW